MYHHHLSQTILPITVSVSQNTRLLVRIAATGIGGNSTNNAHDVFQGNSVYAGKLQLITKRYKTLPI